MRRNRRFFPLLLSVGLILLAWLWLHARPTTAPLPDTRTARQEAPSSPSIPTAPAADAGLPAEARATIELIQRGGPFPHRQDGSMFGNREGRLPPMPRGFYREYTVRTPGVRHRGARRIVTGGQPPRVWYYTDDHYDSFHRFEVNR